MKKRNISALLTAVLLLTGCSGNKTIEQSSAPTTSAVTSDTTPNTTTPPAPTAEAQISGTEEPTAENTEREAYLQELLGEGKIVEDRINSKGIYARMVASDEKLSAYFELPDETIERNCMLIANTISSKIKDADTYGFTSISFVFADHDTQTVAMYSVNKYSGEWTQLMPILWTNDEYEATWNKLSDDSDEN